MARLPSVVVAPQQAPRASPVCSADTTETDETGMTDVEFHEVSEDEEEGPPSDMEVDPITKVKSKSTKKTAKSAKTKWLATPSPADIYKMDKTDRRLRSENNKSSSKTTPSSVKILETLLAPSPTGPSVAPVASTPPPPPALG
ncbi:hypothetical protein EDD11_001876 [Mortierella claussenii]|nr:hypothetical protein EDD11_001876 [Mortierella claussenii]